ncbi:MAG: hypothetical protein K8I00_03215, partial [Candidatus Omnitrophica bacterium]|nr:hypothetical protein [Candidatus Omnitrophota bacterium]
QPGTLLDLSASDAALRLTRLSDPSANITSPLNGMIAYDSTDNELQAYVNGTWVMLAAGGMIDISDDTNLSAGTGIAIFGDTISVQDIYVLTAGDTMTGTLNITAPVVIGSQAAPLPGIILDLSASDAALRLTRLSDPSSNIAAPRNGMIAYDSTDNQLQAYVNGSWVMLAAGGMIDISSDTNLTAGTGITIAGDTVSVQDIYLLTSGDSMSGTLDMAFADPTIQFAAPGADSDFWIGVQDDGGADDDDTFSIGAGTTPGVNTYFTITTDGTIDISGASLLRLPSGAAPVLPTSAGEIVLDTNFISVNQGALRLFDGNQQTHIVSVTGASPADQFIPKYSSGTGLITWQADADSGAPEWNVILDAGAVGTLDFNTFEQSLETSITDGVGGTGLTMRATDLGVGASDVVVFNIDATADDDANYIPLRITDNAGVETLLEVDYQGSLTTVGTLEMQAATDPSIVFTPDGLDSDFWLGVQDDDGADDNDRFQIGGGAVTGVSPFVTIAATGEVGIGTSSPLTGVLLDLSASDAALRVTRLSDPTTSIATPRNGMIAYDSTDNELQAYVNGTWVMLAEGGMIDISDDTNLTAGTGITITGDTVSVQDIYLLTAGDTMTGNLNVNAAVVIGSQAAPLSGVILDLSASDAALRVTRLIDPSTSIATPRNGMIAYDSTDDELQAYVNGTWVMLAEGGMIDISDDTNLTAGTGITITGDTVSVQDIYLLTAGDTMTGTLQFSGVPVDIATATGEDLTIQPGTGGNVIVAQGILAVGTSTPGAGTILDLSATDAALRITRLADPSTSIAAPLNGMIAYDSTDDELQAYVGGTWVMLAEGGMIDISDDTNLTAGTGITIIGDTVSVQDIYVLTAGDSMAGSLQFVGVGSDITTGAGEDLALMPSSGRVGIGITAPPAGVILDLSASDAALRVTRLSDPTTSIATPRNGMIAYDSTDNELQAYVNGTWVMLAEGGMIDISDDTNLTAGTGIAIIGDTVSVQDIYVLTDGDSMTGTLEMSFTDPTIQFAAPGADSDFWVGVQDDGGADNNDVFSIGAGAVPGTNAYFTITTNGTIDLSGASLLRLPSGSAPVLPTSAGEIVLDTNFISVNQGALRLYDGSQEVHVVTVAGGTPGDQFVPKYSSGSGLITWQADADSGAPAWNAILDAGASGTIDFRTFEQRLETSITDAVGGTGLTYRATDLGVGASDVVVFNIDASADDDNNYIPLRITDNVGAETLLEVDYQGSLTTFGTLAMQALTDPSIVFTPDGLDSDFWLGVQDDDGADDNDVFQIGGGAVSGTNPFITIDNAGAMGIGTVSVPSGILLDLSATDAALRVTRLSDPAANIVVPRNGMIAYDSTDDELQAYVGGTWVMLAEGGMIDISDDTNLTAGTGISLIGDTISVQDIYVLTAGDSMTGSLQFVGVGADITTGAGEDLAFMPSSGRVGIGITAPPTGVILDLSASDAALRVTRLTDPATSIVTPRNGMIAYDSTDNELQAYVNGTWVMLAEGGMIDISDDTNLTAGTGISLTGDTISVQDIYLLTAGDTMSGNLNVEASVVIGSQSAPLAGVILDLSASDAALRVTRLSDPTTS